MVCYNVWSMTSIDESFCPNRLFKATWKVKRLDNIIIFAFSHMNYNFSYCHCKSSSDVIFVIC